MKLKWQMNDLRKQLLRQRIHYCRAQVDLAKQNMVQCDKKEKRQQELVTHINEILEKMKEDLKALKARWKQMKEEQRIKEEKWKVIWQSKLLMGAPPTRQMQEKRNWLGSLNSLNLSSENEGRFVLDEREREELSHKLDCKRKYLKRWRRVALMERITLKILRDDFTHHHQFLRLSGILNRELARLQKMNREDKERDKACHPR